MRRAAPRRPWHDRDGDGFSVLVVSLVWLLVEEVVLVSVRSVYTYSEITTKRQWRVFSSKISRAATLACVRDAYERRRNGTDRAVKHE